MEPTTISPALDIVPLTDFNAPYATQLGRELHALSSLNKIDYDWDFVLGRMRWAVRSPDWHVELAMVNGVYTGILVGMVETFSFSPELMGSEVLWFVRPGTAERTRAAAELMRRFVAWALDEKGALRVQSGDIANIDATAVDALYRHLGFTRYGSIFKYERE